MSVRILEVLDRPIAFHRCLVTLTGSINAALMLSQAVYWTRRTADPGGWFWKTQAEWEDETGLTRREQDGARKVLRDMGIFVEEKRGIPQKVFYLIDVPRLEGYMHQSANLNVRIVQPIRTKAPTSAHENAKQDVRKAPSCADAKRQPFNSLITAMNTSETTQSPRAERESDPRHSEFRALLEAYWAYAHPGGEEMLWGAGEAGQLGELLRSSPNLTGEQFKLCLYHRHRSQGVNLSERPRVWLGEVTSYAGGPLNQFHQPAGGSNGHKGEQRAEQIKRDLAAVLAQRNERERMAAQAAGKDVAVLPFDEP